MRKGLSIAIVIGLAFVALQGNFGVIAQPYPNKIVTGFVGPAGTAGFANAVLYLTTQPAGPLVIQNMLDAAIPPDNPTYAQDIGGVNYDWTTADVGLALIETRRGMNGYNGINYTTSVKGTLDTNLVQELSPVTLEAYPVLTTTKVGSDVTVSWTGMADADMNMVSYNVLRSSNGGAGPYTQTGTVTHTPSGAHSYPDTALPDGSYCYKVSVNYRRNQAGTILNSTVGTSEPSCQVISAPPTVANTNPPNNPGAQDILENSNVVITFSKAMTTGSVTVNIVATGPGTVPSFTDSWNAPTNTVLTKTNNGMFSQCNDYNVTVNGNDASGTPMTASYQFQFSIICPNPIITLTAPADGEIGVPLDTDIVITFSKAIDTATFVYNINPTVTMDTPVWSVGDTVVTLAHSTDPFAACTDYTVTVTAADDLGGNPLTGAPVSWTFTSNCVPTVSVISPTAGCFASGDVVHIDWSPTTDDLTLPANLIFDVTYNNTVNGVISIGAGMTYDWTPLGVEGQNIRIVVNATDEAGDIGSGMSEPFDIDVTSPTVPSSGPTGAVPYAATIHITVNFSESMDRASVESVISFTPTLSTTPVYTWSNQDMQLDIAAIMVADTDYTIRIEATAHDQCGASGNAMASAYTMDINVGPKKPRAPVLHSIGDADKTKDSITLSWDAVTLFEDGTTITSATTITYRVYKGTSLIGTVSTTSYTDTGLTADTEYTYTVYAVANGTTMSNPSQPATARTLVDGGPDLMFILLILIIVIVVVVIIAALLMRKKKPEVMEEIPMEEVPPEEVVLEEAPPEEAPVEEAPLEEEAPVEEGEAPPEGEAAPEGEGKETPPPV